MGSEPRRNCELRCEEPVTIHVCREKLCRCGWAHVVRGGHGRELPACRILRRQNSERSQTWRSAGRAAEKVRVDHQSQDSKANRPDDSTKRAGESGQGDQVTNEAKIDE